ncbi:MAG: hypothetical protein AAGD35_18810, partial [Actinomycetota bacterium]
GFGGEGGAVGRHGLGHVGEQIEIEAAVKDGYDLSYMRDTIARILGPDHPHLDLLADMTQAVPTHRAAFTPEAVDGEAMTEEIVSLIESLAGPGSATAP